MLLAYRFAGQEPNYQAALLCFLSMFWVYTFAKAVHFDPEADAVNDPERTAFLKEHRAFLISLGLAGLCYGVLTTYSRGWWALGCFLMPTFAGLLYDLKLLPASFTYRRLKDIPGVKGLTVAVAWAWLVAGMSYEFSDEPRLVYSLAIGLWTCLLWFINTTYFDLGDVKGDRLEGTRTLPIELGFSRTRNLLHLMNLCHLGMGALFVTVGLFAMSVQVLLGLALSGLQAVQYVAPFIYAVF